MDVLSIVGTRPQLIKLKPIVEAFENSYLQHGFVDTGQHYDISLNDNLYQDLGLSDPIKKINVRGLDPINQISKIIIVISELLTELNPKIVLVYGDTNSTLAAAIATKKTNFKLAHIEAGLRSNNFMMSEEINRRAVDHISDYLFAPTQNAFDNLRSESVFGEIHFVGDVMLDLILNFEKSRNKENSNLRENFILLTLHRAENVDNVERLLKIIHALNYLPYNCILPIHPRLENILKKNKITLPRNISKVAPLTHTEVLEYLCRTKLVITDSGGLQKEAFFMGTPCITLRNETEWPETLKDNANKLLKNLENLSEYIEMIPTEYDVSPFGDGKAAQKIVTSLERYLK